MLNKVNESLQRLLFNQELEFYKTRLNKIVAVNPLCGSRTLHHLSKEGYLSRSESIPYPHYCVFRDEKKRFLSAYNKKILSSNDWKKIVLRNLNGLALGMSFTDFLLTLLARKKAGKYIDKHFRPCIKTGRQSISIDDSNALSEALEIPLTLLSNNKFATSREVVDKRFGTLTTLSAADHKLLESYLSLYE